MLWVNSLIFVLWRRISESTLRQKWVSHAVWKLDLLPMLYANWVIYSRNRGVVYTVPVTREPLQRGLIKPWMLAASHRAGWWGLSGLLFVCTLEPLFILKHVLQGSTVALIVWSERAFLSPESDIMRVSALHMICSSLKQDTWNSPGLKLCNTQHWVRWYTPSSSCQVPEGVARVMCFRAREIDPESVHSQPEDWLSSLIIPSTETEADFEWLHS